MSLLIGNCTADAGLGSRLCTNTETLSVDCIPPAQVCDFNTADCPDMSDELNCPCEYILNVKLLPACACVQALAIVLFSITCVYIGITTVLFCICVQIFLCIIVRHCLGSFST